MVDCCTYIFTFLSTNNVSFSCINNLKKYLVLIFPLFFSVTVFIMHSKVKSGISEYYFYPTLCTMYALTGVYFVYVGA